MRNCCIATVLLVAFAPLSSHCFALSHGLRPLAAPASPALLSSADHARFRAPVVDMVSGPEVIDAAVTFDTFAPQFLWLLIVAFPRAKITESVMGPILPLVALSLVHLAIVITAATAPGGTEPILIFGDVFDPAKNQLDGMVRLFQVRDFVAEEWPHVLIWDLFVGRAIWLDALVRGTPFAWASLLLTNGIGPPGLLLYVFLCVINGRGLPTLGYDKSSMQRDE